MPANCTDELQLFDLSINKPAKGLQSKFQEWYSDIIRNQLKDGIEEDADLRLSVTQAKFYRLDSDLIKVLVV